MYVQNTLQMSCQSRSRVQTGIKQVLVTVCVMYGIFCNVGIAGQGVKYRPVQHNLINVYHIEMTV